MKKVTLLIVFTAIVLIVNAQTFFSDSFENGGNFPTGWTLVPGTGGDWAIDQGNDHGPGSAQEGTYCAFFDDYNYYTGTTAEMITPAIDLSSTTLGDAIALSYWYWDGGDADQVEVSVSTDGTNFTPVDTTDATVDPWAQQVVNLSAYAGQSTVYISFKGTSVYGYSNPHVDNILVKKIIADDLSAISVKGPISYCGITTDTIKISIVNVGTASQSSYSASYSIDGGATWTTPESITTTLNPGDTLNYTFTTLADFSTLGTYDIIGTVSLSGDGDNTNDTVTGNSVISAPVITSYPYTQDFEGNQYWYAGGTNSSWQLGTPANTIINSAASGSNAWVTNLTGDYNADENSYVESPCFDFSSLHNPLVQFNYWVDAEGDGSWTYDGAILEYTLDDGATWNTVGSLNDWTNWYNMSSISALSTDGWGGDGSNGSNAWVEAKHLLTALAGQPSVKFRIFFGSDGSVQYEGFGFDDFTIREGEINMVITEINYNGPESGTDTTEFIEWYNAGIDAINVDGFYYSQGVTDTLPNELLLPGDYFVSAYDSTVMADFFGYTTAHTWAGGGLSNGGEDIALHTPWGVLVDSVNFDDANGWPTAADGNGPTLVFCENNIGLDQNDPANWTVSNTYVDSLNSMPVYASPGAMDSTCMFVDVAIVNPPSGDSYDCNLTATDTISISYTNAGNITIPANDTIFAYYQIDTNPVVPDTIVLGSDFNPGDVLSFDFTQTADFSAITTYNWKIWLSYFNDINQVNDTNIGTITHYIPVVDLGADTIYTSQPDTVILDAGPNYDLYNWSDGSTNQTLNISTYGTYYVDAVDTNSCSASDTVYVIYQVPPFDLAIIDPANGASFSDCNLGIDTIYISIANIGDTITAVDTVYAYYQIDGGSVVADTIFVNTDFATGDTLNFAFEQPYDFSAIATYNWKVWISYLQDTIATNDTSMGTLTHYELIVDLGPDTMCTSQPDTVVLDAGTGYNTYLWQDSTTTQTFSVTTYGTYYVTVTDSNGCEAIDSIVIDICTNTDIINQINANIYPNPNNGNFTIYIPKTDDVTLEVVTLSGEIVKVKDHVSTYTFLNVNEFGKGIYIVRLRNKQSVAYYKVVVQ